MASFKDETLKAHNEYRKRHGSVPLKWSSKLEKNARNWAHELASRGYIQHASQNEEGENIACMRGQDLDGQKAVDMWYDEIKDYNFNNPGFNSKTGHFTQVVWAESAEVGVGKAIASSGMQFVVARYYPPGNNLRKFAENVKKSGSSHKPLSPKNNDSKPTNRTAPTTTVRTGGGSNNRQAAAGKQSDKDFRNKFLRSHNMYRKRHGSAPLKFNNKLQKAAQDAAEEAAKTNTLRSVEMNNVGQNMAALTGGELPGERVSEMWYEEEKKFNYNSPGFSSNTGSFTQVIWSGSQEVGVGRAFGNSGQTFVVALYQPPGNVRGQYDENVRRPSGPVPTLSEDKKGCCVVM